MTTNTQTTGDGAGNGTASATSRQPEPRDAKNPFSELRGLIERATSGRWERLPEIDGTTMRTRICDPTGAVVARTNALFGRKAPHFDQHEANAALIVAAVNALPALLDERDRLIGEVAEAKRLAHEAFCIGVGHQDARRSAEAEAQRLRESLTELVAAMHRYERDVDADQPQDHRDMMERARSALSDQGEG